MVVLPMCCAKPPIPKRAGPGADDVAVRGLVQPPAAPVSAEIQNTSAGH